ncbi:MAG: T9SS type A sorting domain-containing protein [Flavobacterium sp.]|nr:T9SS type A sorting domain-containing protein [Flavobacterium sp.]
MSTSGFEKNNMAIYPNPTKNQINLQFPDQVKADKIVISDLTGKIILEQTSSTNQVNVSQMANGMYIIQAFAGKENFQTKFIKE